MLNISCLNAFQRLVNWIRWTYANKTGYERGYYMICLIVYNDPRPFPELEAYCAFQEGVLSELSC